MNDIKYRKFIRRNKIKKNLRKIINSIGLSIDRSNGNYEANLDIGREYQDADDCLPRFCLNKAPYNRWAPYATEFFVNNGKSILKEIVDHSHLTLLKLCKHYNFKSVLDIGSQNGNCTRIFKHIGKKVTSIEIAPGLEADYKNDYIDQKFDNQFDAIWCSQVYEHQRNPGFFLDKIFDELKDGGVLALTVPFQINRTVSFGHINPSSPAMLIYQLVCAGFDCSNISLKVYNGYIGVLLIKKYNGIKRRLPFGVVPKKGQEKKNIKELVGDEIFDNIESYFPFPVSLSGFNLKITEFNWPDPI